MSDKGSIIPNNDKLHESDYHTGNLEYKDVNENQNGKRKHMRLDEPQQGS